MSNKDIRNVTTGANLSVSDLDHHLLELGISSTDIEKYKFNAQSKYSDIRAINVLRE